MSFGKQNTVKVITPQKIVKECSCGRKHYAPPQDAIVAEFCDETFFFFNCECKSTLAWPIEIKEAA